MGPGCTSVSSVDRPGSSLPESIKLNKDRVHLGKLKNYDNTSYTRRKSTKTKTR